MSSLIRCAHSTDRNSTIAALLVASCVITGMISPTQATVRNPAMEGVDAYDPLQDSHMIVRGRVTSIHMESIALGDLLIVDSSDTQPPILSSVQAIDIAIEEVLHGTTQEASITFLVFPGVDLRNGQEVVVCAKWFKGRRLSRFVTNPVLGLYEKRAGRWEQLADPTSTTRPESLTDEELLNRIREVSVASLVAQSDVVASGIIEKVWASSYRTDNERVGDLVHYRLTVTQLLKGNDSDGVLEFVVATENLSFVPTWFRYTPKGLAVGQEWFVLLRKGERGLYPFRGPNSLLKVDGDRLLYDNAVVYPMGVKAFAKQVREEVGDAKE